jgi:hypothetical protein
VEPLAIKELAKGNWQSLVCLSFCNNITIENAIKILLELKNAGKLPN